MSSKKHVSEPSPIKVHPKPSVALVKSCERQPTGSGVCTTIEEVLRACLLLGSGETKQETVRKAQEAICKAAVKAIYVEADRQGLNLVEVDQSIGLGTFR